MVDPTSARQPAGTTAEQDPPEARWRPPAPGGWEFLPLSLVDTAFSLQARYRTDSAVLPPVRRYAEWAAAQLGLAPGALLVGVQDRPGRVHTVGEMIGLLDPLTTEQRVEVFGNRRPASTTPGAPRRADTVVQAAHVLADFGIVRRCDFEERYAHPDDHRELRAAWLSVPGFGKRSWEHMALLCGLGRGTHQDA